VAALVEKCVESFEDKCLVRFLNCLRHVVCAFDDPERAFTAVVQHKVNNAQVPRKLLPRRPCCRPNARRGQQPPRKSQKISWNRQAIQVPGRNQGRVSHRGCGVSRANSFGSLARARQVSPRSPSASCGEFGGFGQSRDRPFPGERASGYRQDDTTARCGRHARR
jgi:hypothetical protein